jgi:hypothetical protein
MRTARRLTPGALAAVAAWLLIGSRLAAGPPPTRPAGRDPAAVAAAIDRHVDARLAEAKVPPSPRADDAEFLRRVSLDVLGRIPTADRAQTFLDDRGPDKRARLIDELLADRAYGEHFATIWYHRMVKPDDDNRYLLPGNKLSDWLADRFDRNQGWDRTVRELLTATGERDRHPATTFFLANVAGAKKDRRPQPNRLTAATSRLFLGVRLECCECHNHPFTDWKQTDFWGMAAFFNTLHADNTGKKDAAKPAVHESGQAGPDGKGARAGKKGASAGGPAPGSIVIPDSKGQTVRAKFLGGVRPPAAPANGQRAQLAAWLTGPRNPYFARAAVNKLWANFFGRGLVNPIDDMRPEAKDTHPEVLRLLADEFVASGFDQKHLVRCLCLSKAYQRSSRVLPGNKDDDKLYSHAAVRAMSADVLFDSLAVALGHPAAEKEKSVGKQKKADTSARGQFRAFFHAEADDDVGVTEDYTHGIPQALRLMNSSRVNDTATVVGRLTKAGGGPDKVIEGLYLRVLSRRPTGAELKRVRAYVADEKDAAKAYGDVAWALLNSGEFLFNH